MWKTFLRFVVWLLFFLTVVKCVKSTEELLGVITKNMDFTQDPCKNFHGYACNNWKIQGFWEMYHEDTVGYQEVTYNKVISNFFEERIKANVTETNEVYEKARKFYEVCIVNEKYLVSPLYLDRIVKTDKDLEWLYMTQRHVEFSDENWHWLTVLGRLRRFGLEKYLLKEELKAKNATAMLIKISKPEEIEFNYYDDKEIWTTRERYDFKQRIRNLTRVYSELHDDEEPVVISLKELKQKIKGFEMEKYLEALLQKPVSEDTEIFMSHFKYFTDLVKLVEITPNDVLAYYIAQRMFVSMPLPGGMVKYNCMDILRSEMYLAINYIYEQEFYLKQKKQIEPLIQFVFDEIKEELLKRISENAANFNETQQNALRDKVNFMKLSIGNLPIGASQQYYTDYYKDLEMTDDFIVNHWNVLKHTVNKEHARVLINSPSIEHTYVLWKSALPTYQREANLMVVPFDHLQKPIFDVDYHELFLFAGVGNVMAHEISNGFDLEGLRFDFEGSPTNLFVDALENNLQIIKLLECLRLESISTIGLKLADFEGLRIAYDIAERLSYIGNYNGGLVLEPPLSDEKLFFVKFAQFYCSEKSRRFDITRDPFKRVPQIVKNHRMFAKVFQCPEQFDAKQSCKLF